jgi:hypothetical protein
MGGLIQQPAASREPDSHWRPILLGIVLVLIIVGIVAVFSRPQPKPVNALHPYAAKVRLTDPKMSAAENFVGASVTYVDGTVMNSGDKILTHAVVHVTFKNTLGETSQVEDIPLHVLQTSGPYPEAVDLSVSPLPPGQSKSFRLTFEHVTDDWDHNYPELQVTDISVK